MAIDKRYINQIEVVTNVFTTINGKIKILLFKRDKDPFKGYWMLPNNLLMTDETIEECSSATIYDFFGLKDIYLRQNHVFSKIDRLPNDRTLAVSLIGLVDYSKVIYDKEEQENLEYSWFDINEIPKMVYDHKTIVEQSIKDLRKVLNKNYELIRILYPHDFTLPELQTTYEHLLNQKLDRRNFRKKLMNLNILIDTNDKNENTNGRPAKLYSFKENLNGDDINE